MAIDEVCLSLKIATHSSLSYCKVKHTLLKTSCVLNCCSYVGNYLQFLCVL